MSNLLKNIILWVLKLVPVGILMMTVLVYKFPGHEESVELFTKLSDGLGNIMPESNFRIGTGVMEVIASLLLLIPKTARNGALLTIGIMLGAIASHIMFLGIDDVFGMAIIVLVSAVLYLLLSKKWNQA